MISQLLPEPLRIGGRKITDGVDKHFLRRLLCCPAYAEQICHRKRPDGFPEGIPLNDRHAVGLVLVRAQLGEHLVEGHADRNRQSQLKQDCLADLLCHLHLGAEDGFRAVLPRCRRLQPGISSMPDRAYTQRWHKSSPYRSAKCFASQVRPPFVLARCLRDILIIHPCFGNINVALVAYTELILDKMVFSLYNNSMRRDNYEGKN